MKKVGKAAVRRAALGAAKNLLQLDWPSETDTLKINLSQYQEGYDRFEYTYKKLSARRIQWCGDPSFIFTFWGIFEE